jgi:hypothetical protein
MGCGTFHFVYILYERYVFALKDGLPDRHSLALSHFACTVRFHVGFAAGGSITPTRIEIIPAEPNKTGLKHYQRLSKAYHHQITSSFHIICAALS